MLATSSGLSLHRCAGLFLPSVFVHALHEEPQRQRYFGEEADAHKVGEKKTVCEAWCQKGQAPQASKCTENTQNSWQEGRLENEEAGYKKVESKKHYADVHDLRMQFEE